MEQKGKRRYMESGRRPEGRGSWSWSWDKRVPEAECRGLRTARHSLQSKARLQHHCIRSLGCCSRQGVILERDSYIRQNEKSELK